jgi:hypothetical protein
MLVGGERALEVLKTASILASGIKRNNKRYHHKNKYDN